jgi:hypothetical protein
MWKAGNLAASYRRRETASKLHIHAAGGRMGVAVEEPEAGTRQPDQTRWRRAAAAVWPSLASLLVCLALAALVFARNWASPASRTIGPGGGDGALFMWFLQWTSHALEHGLNPLFTTHINVPDGVNVMWNTSLLLPGLLLAPITTIFGPVLSFNLLLALGSALSAWCAAIAFRRYVRLPFAALLGGLLYGFSPYMMAQSLGHLHLTLVFLVPLLLLVLDEILVRQRWRPLVAGAALGLLAACQLFIGEEVLAFTAIIGLAQLLLLVVLFPRQVPSRVGYALLALAAAAVVFAALAAWPLAFQLTGPQRVSGDLHLTERAATDLYGLVVPNRVQAIAPDAAVRLSSRFPGNLAEVNGYLGVPLVLILVFTAVRWWRSPAVRVAALLLLVPLVLSMGTRLQIGGRRTGIPLPWAAIDSLPLLENAGPSRFMLLTTLFAGLLLAVFTDRARDWATVPRLVALAMIMAAFLAIVPRVPRGGVQVQVPAFFTGRDVQRIPEGSVALLAPYPSPRNASPMFWQAVADLRFRMPGGYFVGPDPSGRPRYGPNPRRLSGVMSKIQSGWRAPKLGPGLRAELAGDLAHWRVGTVVVGPTKGQATMVQFFTELVGRRPSQVGGVWVWWDVRPAAAVSAPPRPAAGPSSRSGRPRR